MYVQYKVTVSENQVNTLKDAIRLKKGAALYIPKGGIRGGHVLLFTPGTGRGETGTDSHEC